MRYYSLPHDTFIELLRHYARNDVERRLGEGFEAAINDFMTSWGRSGFQSGGDPVPVAAPIGFEHDGVSFRYVPRSLPRHGPRRACLVNKSQIRGDGNESSVVFRRHQFVSGVTRPSGHTNQACGTQSGQATGERHA